MNKKLVVAVAITLIFVNGSSIALASGGGGDSSTTSTTVPTRSRLTNTQRAAQQAAQRAAQQAQNDAIAKYKVELSKYLESRKLINTTFTAAMVDAQRSFKIARESATTGLARSAAVRAFNVAVRTATEAKNDALRTLGAPPTKPVRP